MLRTCQLLSTILNKIFDEVMANLTVVSLSDQILHTMYGY